MLESELSNLREKKEKIFYMMEAGERKGALFIKINH
jgi:hypothetical protein